MVSLLSFWNKLILLPGIYWYLCCMATLLYIIFNIYSRRKPLFSSFGEHTAVCGSSVRQAVARPRHRQSVCIHNIHVAPTCRSSVLGSATKTRPHVAKQSGQCARALSYGRIFCLQSQKIDGATLFPYFILYFVSNILTLCCHYYVFIIL